MVGVVTGPVFSKIANSLVDAFQKRAVEVYGQR
jgi:ribosome-associated toxin RatA of RatAB toxin-antitoxin module